MKRLLPALLALCTIQPSLASPWFTGPLLAGAGHTLPAGHINIEPYFSFTDAFAVYNNHWKITKIPDTKTYNTTPVITMGINDFMDFQSTLPYDYHVKQGQKQHAPSDMSAVVGFQLLEEKEDSWQPNLRFAVAETFPTGAYEGLSPTKLAVDAFGGGSYQTTLNFNFQKMFKPMANHYLRTRATFAYNMPNKVNLHGFNTYGGGFGTNGSLSPGKQFQADLAFEFQLTKHWVPVLEFNYLEREASSFTGTVGTLATGAPATVGNGTVELYSIAPAIEYNINGNIGVIAGAWLTLKGKDTADFSAAMLAINIFV